MTTDQYIVGMLDACGRFSVNNYHRSYRLSVTHNLPEVLTLLKDRWGGTINGNRWTLASRQRIEELAAFWMPGTLRMLDDFPLDSDGRLV